jgi:hypothetical protein
MGAQAGYGGDLLVDSLCLSVIYHPEGDGVVIWGSLKVAILRRSVYTMLCAVRVQGFDEVSLVCREQGKPLSRCLTPLNVKIRLLSIASQLLQFDKPIQGSYVGDGKSCQVCLSVSPIRALPSGVAGRKQVPGRARQEEVVRCVLRVSMKFAQRSSL